MLQFLTDTYTFFKIQSMDISIYSQNGLVGTIQFVRYFHSIIVGKAYKEQDDADEIYLAFEKNTPQGKADYAQVQDEIQYAINSGSIDNPLKINK